MYLCWTCFATNQNSGIDEMSCIELLASLEITQVYKNYITPNLQDLVTSTICKQHFRARDRQVIADCLKHCLDVTMQSPEQQAALPKGFVSTSTNSVLELGTIADRLVGDLRKRSRWTCLLKMP